MKFDPRTESDFEQDVISDDLKTMAETLVCLDAMRNVIGDCDDDAIAGITIAFEDIWNYALRFTDVMTLYRTMESIKNEQKN